ncbi:MAG: stalk domain-containing protein [Firmicutes bacterium]|nr:stalk domain-containing protein [Bacillota bacterium]
MTAGLGTTVITFKIGDDLLIDGNNKIKIETAHEIFGERTLIQSRTVSESIKASVDGNKENRIVTINTAIINDKEEYIRNVPV